MSDTLCPRCEEQAARRVAARLDPERESYRYCPYGCANLRVREVLQLQGGSDSGGVWAQKLQIKAVYRDGNDLIIEVL